MATVKDQARREEQAVEIVSLLFVVATAVLLVSIAFGTLGPVAGVAAAGLVVAAMLAVRGRRTRRAQSGGPSRPGRRPTG